MPVFFIFIPKYVNMDIVIIGSGNVATHLGKALKSTHNIVTVFSRNIEKASELADMVGAKAVNNLKDIPANADFYIISVKDDAIKNIVNLTDKVNGIVMHTAGSISIDELNHFSSYGVFYPFQTFTKNKEVNFNNIPVLIEGNTDETRKKIHDLALSISEKVYNVSSEQRLMLHISAVFACNFVNHFYHIAETILKKADLPFDLLIPLITETADKVQSTSPFLAQTGPASRNDQDTIQKHLDVLHRLNEKRAENIYREISEDISEIHKDSNQKK